MNENVVRFYPKLHTSDSTNTSVEKHQELEIPGGTCTDAETFALRVGDASMEPEFAEGCVIVIDPTGLATDGAYVLADLSNVPEASQNTSRTLTDKQIEQEKEEGDYVFRQLIKSADGWVLHALNQNYRQRNIGDTLSNVIIGVIVQRAGTRRSYHKNYDI